MQCSASQTIQETDVQLGSIYRANFIPGFGSILPGSDVWGTCVSSNKHQSTDTYLGMQTAGNEDASGEKELFFLHNGIYKGIKYGEDNPDHVEQIRLYYLRYNHKSEKYHFLKTFEKNIAERVFFVTSSVPLKKLQNESDYTQLISQNINLMRCYPSDDMIGKFNQLNATFSNTSI